MSVKVEIKEPIWNGGNPAIGIADFRVKGADRIIAKISYKKEDGTLMFPETYIMGAGKLKSYPTKVVGKGIKVYVAPLTDWEVRSV